MNVLVMDPVLWAKPAVETSGKASGKILDLMRDRHDFTIPELAAALGITERSVERNIQKLQQEQKIK